MPRIPVRHIAPSQCARINVSPRTRRPDGTEGPRVDRSIGPGSGEGKQAGGVRGKAGRRGWGARGSSGEGTRSAPGAATYTRHPQPSRRRRLQPPSRRCRGDQAGRRAGQPAGRAAGRRTRSSQRGWRRHRHSRAEENVRLRVRVRVRDEHTHGFKRSARPACTWAQPRRPGPWHPGRCAIDENRIKRRAIKHAVPEATSRCHTMPQVAHTRMRHTRSQGGGSGPMRWPHRGQSCIGKRVCVRPSMMRPTCKSAMV